MLLTLLKDVRPASVIRICTSPERRSVKQHWKLNLVTLNVVIVCCWELIAAVKWWLLCVEWMIGVGICRRLVGRITGCRGCVVFSSSLTTPAKCQLHWVVVTCQTQSSDWGRASVIDSACRNNSLLLVRLHLAVMHLLSIIICLQLQFIGVFTWIHWLIKIVLKYVSHTWECCFLFSYFLNSTVS